MLDLRTLSDRFEIQDLLVRYADALDRRDYDRLDRVFTPDAAIDYTAFGGIAGAYPEIKVWLAEVLAVFPGFQHIVGNADVRLAGDKATGRIICFNPVILPGGAQPPQVGFNGLWYIDDYVRTDAGWRIARRSEERSFSHNFTQAGA